MSENKERQTEQRRTKEEEDCVYVIPDCDPDNAPAVSSDCGHTDTIVRANAQSRYRNLADPVEEPKARYIGTCKDLEGDEDEADTRGESA